MPANPGDHPKPWLLPLDAAAPDLLGNYT